MCSEQESSLGESIYLTSCGNAFIEKSFSLYWLGLYEASSIRVCPTLFHADYSGRLSYSESAGLYFALVNLTLVVAETATIMFRPLFAVLAVLLFYGGSSYGFYHLTETISPFTMPSKSEVGTIEHIVISTYLGAWSLCFFSCVVFMSLILLLIPIAVMSLMTYFMIKGLITFFFEVRKYFTVDVGPADAPV